MLKIFVIFQFYETKIINDVTHFTDWGLTSLLTSVFHKVVWQHVCGEVGYLMTALLQISRTMFQ